MFMYAVGDATFGLVTSFWGGEQRAHFIHSIVNRNTSIFAHLIQHWPWRFHLIAAVPSTALEKYLGFSHLTHFSLGRCFDHWSDLAFLLLGQGPLYRVHTDIYSIILAASMLVTLVPVSRIFFYSNILAASMLVIFAPVSCMSHLLVPGLYF